MQFIKSLIFNIFLYVGLITIFVLAIPTLVLPSKFTIFFGRVSARYIVFLLKIILNTNVIFHGVENLKKVDNFFVASAHQSMFETFALQIPLDGPIFILKKELLSIPLFGWYLRKIGSIAIIRETTTKENLNFFDKVSLKKVPLVSGYLAKLFDTFIYSFFALGLGPSADSLADNFILAGLFLNTLIPATYFSACILFGLGNLIY